MSVCTFSIEELANVAGAIVANRPTHFSPYSLAEDIGAACESLALVSKANAACFNDRYSHKGANAQPHTAKEISEALCALDSRPGSADVLTRAIGTVRLMHYNCTDDGGDFTLKIEGAHAALISILEGLMLACARKAGIS